MELRKSQTFFLGLQHVLAMYAGAVIVPIIVGSSLNLTTMQIAYLIGADLLTSGIATLLQVWRNRFFGIGLPVVLGCTFTAVFPMIAIGKELGLGAIYGAIITSGLIVFIISHWFGKLVRFFPPVVTGSIVTVIGVTLVPVAMNNLAGAWQPGFWQCYEFEPRFCRVGLHTYFKSPFQRIYSSHFRIAGTHCGHNSGLLLRYG